MVGLGARAKVNPPPALYHLVRGWPPPYQGGEPRAPGPLAPQREGNQVDHFHARWRAPGACRLCGKPLAFPPNPPLCPPSAPAVMATCYLLT